MESVETRGSVLGAEVELWARRGLGVENRSCVSLWTDKGENDFWGGGNANDNQLSMVRKEELCQGEVTSNGGAGARQACDKDWEKSSESGGKELILETGTL